MRKQVNYEYHRKSLDGLFKKEEEVIERISEFCERNNKEIITEYFLTATSPLQFILKIKVR